jgi:hypothetical protein
MSKASIFEKSSKDKKADKKHGKPEGSKTDRMQDKSGTKEMPAPAFMKKSGSRGR